jgi:pentatricopeptide repeat protein
MPGFTQGLLHTSRQSVKQVYHNGLPQTLVAGTHPVGLSHQSNRQRFTRRPSTLAKFGSYANFQNAFQTSVSSSSLGLHDGRLEKTSVQDSGLKAYFDAWQKSHKAGEQPAEWTQFQFQNRIEWKPENPVQELTDIVEEAEVQVALPARIPLERRSSESAIDQFKKAQNEAVAAQLEEAAIERAEETPFATRVPTPPIAPWQSPALTFESTLQKSPASSVTTVASAIDVQSQKSAEHLDGLANNGRYSEIIPAFAGMLAAGIQPITLAYNALLTAAIHRSEDSNDVASYALTIYTDMLKRKVSLDTKAYDTLINILASRSLEVSTQMKSLEARRIRFGGMEEAGKFMFASHELDYAILSEDDRLDVAMKLFNDSTSSVKHRTYPAETYLALISACAQSGRVSDMVRVHEHMEAQNVVPMGSTFPAMIQGYAKSLDLNRAVVSYTQYRDLASSHDNGIVELADRQDAAVYAALVKAYVDSDRMAGAMKFYNKIIATWGDKPAVLQALKNVVVSRGFVQSMIERENFAEALSWSEGLESAAKIDAMSRISTAAADKGDKFSAMSAFAQLPIDFSGLATSASAMLALSIRQGDVAAASHYWQILSAPSTMITSELIEPTAMYAVAMIGSGQIAEGLSQSEQMFAHIKASAPANVQLNDEVDEAIAFVGRYVADRGVSDPRLVETAPVYVQETYTPVQYTASVAPPSYEDSYDPYAATTDLKGSALISDELERSTGRAKVSRLNEALTRFRNSRRAGRHPRYITYAKLISAAAREERMNTVQDILQMAKTDVPLLSEYAVVRYGWVSILDAMVGACLTLGNRGLAAQYHRELLDMGAAPTANTFGLYITTLKESTKTFDEATEAVKIFHRAKSEGVEPTSFLYNALIGKLGKARRIDDCLFYFAEMRALGIRPTSVTYGTIVNALCRVSDEKFAEQLFEEMESMPNYKARPAPYNSLMQFFLSTKRDKSKVLAYYERMKSKGIQPTNHTYKLLVDTHATLEPANMAAAEAILDVIRSTGQKPEAVHYSALIHAKGCNLHDIDGARSVFNAVLSDPSIRPQACIYQAMFEGLVANHQVADTEPILKDMASRRVEMTPYIANCLIHGWANEKRIDKAITIFAAVPQAKREPSTYEAMTRAYLAVEDRHSATNVVNEMMSRGYPNAVSGKILELVSGGYSELA